MNEDLRNKLKDYMESDAFKEAMDGIIKKKEEEEERLSQLRRKGYKLFLTHLNLFLEHIVLSQEDKRFMTSDYQDDKKWELDGLTLDDILDIITILTEIYPEVDYTNVDDDEAMFLQKKIIFTWHIYHVTYYFYYGQGESNHIFTLT